VSINFIKKDVIVIVIIITIIISSSFENLSIIFDKRY